MNKILTLAEVENLFRNKVVQVNVYAELNNGKYKETFYLPKEWWEKAERFFYADNEGVNLGELDGKYSEVEGCIYIDDTFINKKDIAKSYTQEDYCNATRSRFKYIYTYEDLGYIIGLKEYEEYIEHYAEYQAEDSIPLLSEDEWKKAREGCGADFKEAYREMNTLLDSIEIKEFLD